jgi:hypothetical protein
VTWRCVRANSSLGERGRVSSTWCGEDVLVIALQDEVVSKVPWSCWSRSARENPRVVMVGSEQICFGVVESGFIVATCCTKAIVVETLALGFLVLVVDGLLVGGDH